MLAERFKFLISTLEEHDIPVTQRAFSQIDTVQLQTLYPDVSLGLVDEIYHPIGTVEFTINWPIGPLRVYPQDQLSKCQDGYGWTFDKPNKAWDFNKLVIADLAADPISLDVNTGKIYHSVHGMRSWTFDEICPDFEHYLKLLLHWVNVYYGTYNGNLFDDDLGITDNTLNAIQDRFLAAGFNAKHTEHIMRMVDS